MSRGCAQSLKKECVGLVVGPVVFIVEKNAIIFPEFSFDELGYLNPAVQNRTVRMDVVLCVCVRAPSYPAPAAARRP